MTRIPFLASVAACGLAAGAQAGLLPTSVTVHPEAGNYRWTYAVVLPTDMQLQTGDYFTIYDFAGRVPGGELVPDGWALSVAAGGGTPDRLNPNDDPAVPNLTWTYAGPAVLTGQVGLGNFWAVSGLGEDRGREGAFTSQTHRSSDGLSERNLTETLVPAGGGGPPAPAPEPGTLALAGLGLPLIGLARLVRGPTPRHRQITAAVSVASGVQVGVCSGDAGARVRHRRPSRVNTATTVSPRAEVNRTAGLPLRVAGAASGGTGRE